MGPPAFLPFLLPQPPAPELRGLAPPSGIPNRFLERPAFDIPGGRHKLNPSQNAAVREALQKQFTVIQGPPGGARPGGRSPAAWRSAHRPLPTGTGKTVVGFHIVFWFYKLNEELEPAWSSPCPEKQRGPCILYCGPSNKSVDVVAGALGRPRAVPGWRPGQSLTPGPPPGMLLSRRAELKPLRVYSEQAEATDFPVPGVSSRGPARKTPREGKPNQSLRCRLSVSVCLSACLWWRERPLQAHGPALGNGQHGASRGSPARTITLHHRIRQSSNPFAPSIKDFDAQLQRGEVLPEEDLAR